MTNIIIISLKCYRWSGQSVLKEIFFFIQVKLGWYGILNTFEKRVKVRFERWSCVNQLKEVLILWWNGCHSNNLVCSGYLLTSLDRIYLFDSLINSKYTTRCYFLLFIKQCLNELNRIEVGCFILKYQFYFI
jgi:hypothetical protein